VEDLTFDDDSMAKNDGPDCGALSSLTGIVSKSGIGGLLKATSIVHGSGRPSRRAIAARHIVR